MTRGNQRDLARAKNLKKTQDLAKKNKDDGLTATARKVGRGCDSTKRALPDTNS